MRCSKCRNCNHTSKTCLNDYNKLERVEKCDKECSICLTKTKKSYCKTQCDHYYHIKCIKEWLKENSTCPMCRKCLREPKIDNLVERILDSILQNNPTILFTDDVLEFRF